MACCLFRTLRKLQSINHLPKVSAVLTSRNVNTNQPDKSAGYEVIKDRSEEERAGINHVFNKVNHMIDNNNYGRNFAIVHMFGQQHMIHSNDIILLKHGIGADVGDKIKLEKCLVVGNQHFTLFGRPLLHRDLVQIEATVLEKTMSHTYYNILHRKREHGFKRWLFNRQPLAMLRINHIIICHRLNETQTQVQ